MSEPNRGYHDIGGRRAGPVEKSEFPFEAWQKEGEALRVALEARTGLVSLDELRRAFETFGEELYETLGFYERRAEALTIILDEKGVLLRAEVEDRMTSMARGQGRHVDHAKRRLS